KSLEKMETAGNVSNGAGPVNEQKEKTLRPEDLSEMLAAGTKQIHEKAENTQFVKDFLRGRIRKELFKVKDYFTKQSLQINVAEKVSFTPTFHLHRHEALARDLEYFYGPEWKSHASCSKATQQYVDRIHQVGQEDPVLLVAHAYTRYMGDLSGGQVLKKVAQRALKLPPTGEGLEFYQFDAIHSAKAFKQLYRSRMNELEVDMETKKRLVDEAVKAFLFNIEVRGQAEGAVVFHFVDLCPDLLCVTAASGGTAYVRQLAMAALRHPTGQVLFATWFAALAGLVAWYLM
uniref:heme oxygenase (biliverdin-producing) n=1 Tax=Neolamprologus brichardi TaxID=32507 RepID=A0A3Q4I3U4_NEOBR